MPTPQLFSAIVEDAINRILALDEHSKERCKPLNGKRLQVHLHELPFDLLFVVSGRIDVLSISRGKPDEKSNTSQKKEMSSDADCVISCSVFILSELRHVANITSLLKEGKLSLEGDIQLAQQFSQLFKGLDVDWEEQLAKHTGDIIAHQVGVIGKKLFDKLDKVMTQTSVAMRDAAIEEKGIAVPRTLVEQFNDDVFDLQGRMQKLEHRISVLDT